MPRLTFRKLNFVLLLLIALCVIFGGCRNPLDDAAPETTAVIEAAQIHVCSFGEWTVTKEPTCTEEGRQERLCACGAAETETIPAAGHLEQVIAGDPASCLRAGRTEGKKCAVCGVVIAEPQEIPAAGHRERIIKGKDATCLEDGLTDGKRCMVCGVWLSEQQVIPGGHQEEIIPAIAATCSQPGRTEGRICTVCGTVTREAWTTNRLQHLLFAEPTEELPVTRTHPGYQAYHCVRCGEALWMIEIMPEASKGLAYTVNADRKSCTVTGYGTCRDPELVIPETINGYTVTAVGARAFEKSALLQSVVLPDSITSIGDRAFADCASLGSLAVGNGITTAGREMIANCPALWKVFIHDIAAWSRIGFQAPEDNPLYYGGMLYLYGTPVTDVELPWNADRIGDYAFAGYKTLENVVLRAHGVEIGDGAFMNSGLHRLHVEGTVASVGERAFENCQQGYGLYIDDIAAWCSVSFKGGYGCNPMDGAGSLYVNGEQVGHLTLPEGITEISEWAFYGADMLKSIVLPEGVTSIGEHAFHSCRYMTEITLPETLTSIGAHAFDFCTTLKNVTVPEKVTEVGEYAFNECVWLEKVKLPKSVTVILPYTFYYCECLNEIAMPGVTEIGEYAFAMCLQLNTVLPETLTSIGAYAFNSCYWMENVAIPDGIKRIDAGAFCGCRRLKKIVIPENVTAIGDMAFSGCDSLEEITIPAGVTDVGENAFGSCWRLAIICAAPSAPAGWHENWNPLDRPVTWGGSGN